MMVIPVGIIAPPVKPWPTLPMIISVRFDENPQAIEKPMNNSAMIIRNRRNPNTRSSHAVSGMITISDTR